MAGRNHNMAFSTGAHCSGSEEQSVQGCSRTSHASTTSSNDLRYRKSEDTTSHLDNCAKKVAPAVVQGRANGRFRDIFRKIFSTVWAIFQSIQFWKPIVASKIEQSRPSLHLKPREMNKIMRRLSSSHESAGESFRVGERWQEIQGCDGWANLLSPMDPGLRAEIYRYGEFAKATYDAFDKSTGCKHREKELLKQMGLEDRGYEISQFLYATAQLHLPNFFSKFLDVKKWKSSNWMGFVAVCTAPREIERLGRRDIVVAWRGTITLFEWMKDFQFWWKPVQCNPQNTAKGFKVESGFLSVYNSSNENSLYDKKSASDQVLGAVKELVERYKKEDKQKDIKLSITITGHSLGSALATLSAYDIAESTWINQPQENSTLGSGSKGIGRSEDVPDKPSFPNGRIPITVYSFAGPRVGKRAFKKRIEELGVPVLRLINKHDIVPKFPCAIFSSYEHVGKEFHINNLTCEYIDETKLVRSSTEITEEKAAIMIIHAHAQQVNRRMLHLGRYLKEQHRLLNMLNTISPTCLRAYVIMMETLHIKRLLFRRRLRTSYLVITILEFLYGRTATPPQAQPEDHGDIPVDDVVDGATDGVRPQIPIGVLQLNTKL